MIVIWLVVGVPIYTRFLTVKHALRGAAGDLELRSLSKMYGPSVAVDDFSPRVAPGEFIALLGPSGCGKTTTLRMIAGFVEPTAGTILRAWPRHHRSPPNRRDMGMVFQSYALFPHMTVRQNIDFGLRWRRRRASRDRPARGRRYWTWSA